MRPCLGHRELPLILVLALGLVGYPLAGQALDAPRYRPRDAATRAAHMVDSIARLDVSARAVRRLMVDTLTGGAFWLEFEPAALAGTLAAATPEAAAARFLNDYGSKVFGISSGGTTIDFVKSHTDGNITHLRYQQTHAGHIVLGGQLALHVARMEGGIRGSAGKWSALS